MKVIGRTELKSTENGEITNLPYVGGFIVELTEYEVRLLALLQDTCKGYGWDTTKMFNDPHYKPEDVDMVEAFSLVRLFVSTRFAVNDFKKMVSELESTLNRLEE